MSELSKRWVKLSQNLSNTDTAVSYYDTIVEYYTEEHRYYHTLEHIGECLDLHDEIKHQLDDPMIVEMAIWFHDIIYNPKSKTNVEDSREIAFRFSQEYGLDEADIKKLDKLIETTRTHICPEFNDGKNLVDIDLSILGQSPHRFWEYEDQIRQEYQFVPDNIYQKKRQEILETFLNREVIYCTDYFKEKFEHQARINIRALFDEYSTK